VLIVRRGWAKLGAAVAGGVFLLLEVGLRVAGGAEAVPSIEDDPESRPFYFAMPRAVERIFVLDQEAEVFRTDPRLTEGDEPWAQDQEFPAQRTTSAIRIAFVGGSSLQGRPFKASATFPALAGAALEARFPGRRVDILNLGSGPANSRQIGRIADQLGPLRPDVLVFHTGDNDAGYCAFHEALLTASKARRRPVRRLLEASAIHHRLRRFREDRWGRTADRGLFGPEQDTSQLGVEVPTGVPSLSESVFEIEAGWEDEYAAQTYADLVEEHDRLLPELFERTLRELVRNARDQGMEVVLAIPASNLRDFAPRVSLHHRPGAVSRRTSKRFHALIKLARERMRRSSVAFTKENLPIGDPQATKICSTVLPLLDEALEISDSWADAHFLRGTCLLHTDRKAAATALRKARDLSPAHAPNHRASGSILAAVARVAEQEETPVIDLPAALAAASEAGVPGSDLFLDNVHLNAAGHRIAASAVADVLAQLRTVRLGGANRAPDPSPKEFVALRDAAEKQAERRQALAGMARTRETTRQVRDHGDLKAGNLGEDDYGLPDDPVPRSPNARADPRKEDRSGNVGEHDVGIASAAVPASTDTVGPEPRAPVSPDALSRDELDRSTNVGEYDVGVTYDVQPAPRTDTVGPDPRAPVSPDAVSKEEDRSGNLGEDDFGAPTAPKDELPTEDWNVEPRATDRSGNLGEGDHGDPSGNLGEDDHGPVADDDDD
jgi:lysophospholipase L1-like esterase